MGNGIWKPKPQPGDPDYEPPPMTKSDRRILCWVGVFIIVVAVVALFFCGFLIVEEYLVTSKYSKCCLK